VLGAGFSLDLIKTFSSGFSINGRPDPNDTTRFLLYRQLMSDPLYYQEHRNGSIFKFYYSYTLCFALTLKKPLSEIVISANYCPQKVGVGPFEFQNTDDKSEGHISLNNSRL
jgi:hypothetical protein